MANDGSRETLGFNRRKLLRHGMLAGFGAAIIGVAAPGFTGGARAAAATRARRPVSSTGDLLLSSDGGIITYLSGQSGWSFCEKCKELFYGNEQSSSVCPAGGNHDKTGSSDYVAATDIVGGGITIQQNWHFCEKCKALFYGPEQSSSVCAAGGNHDGSGSSNYWMVS